MSQRRGQLVSVARVRAVGTATREATVATERVTTQSRRMGQPVRIRPAPVPLGYSRMLICECLAGARIAQGEKAVAGLAQIATAAQQKRGIETATSVRVRFPPLTLRGD
uniref:Uncharacterized protein n=1 Tax=viral metagenome TaxID=1070528 RepID=A0A6M3LB54_9ZZZZ